MNNSVAILDACVLYSAALRDLFMWLAVSDIFRPKWTEQIHQEWIGNLLKNRPELMREKLERARSLMNSHAERSLVEDYEHRIAALTLPDANDRHVLAAAIEAGASVIVTFNLSDFPRRVLSAYGIEAQHPDVFLSALFEENSAAFLEAVREMIAELKNPPRTWEQHLDVLRRQGLTKTVESLAAAN